MFRLEFENIEIKLNKQKAILEIMSSETKTDQLVNDAEIVLPKSNTGPTQVYYQILEKVNLPEDIEAAKAELKGILERVFPETKSDEKLSPLTEKTLQWQLDMFKSNPNSSKKVPILHWTSNSVDDNFISTQIGKNKICDINVGAWLFEDCFQAFFSPGLPKHVVEESILKMHDMHKKSGDAKQSNEQDNKTLEGLVVYNISRTGCDEGVVFIRETFKCNPYIKTPKKGNEPYLCIYIPFEICEENDPMDKCGILRIVEQFMILYSCKNKITFSKDELMAYIYDDGLIGKGTFAVSVKYRIYDNECHVSEIKGPFSTKERHLQTFISNDLSYMYETDTNIFVVGDIQNDMKISYKMMVYENDTYPKHKKPEIIAIPISNDQDHKQIPTHEEHTHYIWKPEISDCMIGSLIPEMKSIQRVINNNNNNNNNYRIQPGPWVDFMEPIHKDHNVLHISFIHDRSEQKIIVTKLSTSYQKYYYDFEKFNGYPNSTMVLNKFDNANNMYDMTQKIDVGLDNLEGVYIGYIIHEKTLYLTDIIAYIESSNNDGQWTCFSGKCQESNLEPFLKQHKHKRNQMLKEGNRDLSFDVKRLHMKDILREKWIQKRTENSSDEYDGRDDEIGTVRHGDDSDSVDSDYDVQFQIDDLMVIKKGENITFKKVSPIHPNYVRWTISDSIIDKIRVASNPNTSVIDDISYSDQTFEVKGQTLSDIGDYIVPPCYGEKLYEKFPGNPNEMKCDILKIGDKSILVYIYPNGIIDEFVFEDEKHEFIHTKPETKFDIITDLEKLIGKLEKNAEYHVVKGKFHVDICRVFEGPWDKKDIESIELYPFRKVNNEQVLKDLKLVYGDDGIAEVKVDIKIAEKDAYKLIYTGEHIWSEIQTPSFYTAMLFSDRKLFFPPLERQARPRAKREITYNLSERGEGFVGVRIDVSHTKWEYEVIEILGKKDGENYINFIQGKITDKKQMQKDVRRWVKISNYKYLTQ
jgi:hypothetical protein